jgi:hypothetical protein
VVLLVLGAAVVGVRQLVVSPDGDSGSDQGSTAQADGSVLPEATATADAATKPFATADPRQAHTGAEPKVKLGVFVGTSPNGVRNFSKWLGRKPQYVIDFSARGSWTDISTPDYAIDAWRGSGYRMVYSVAMLPWNGDVSIKAGAQGAYDEHFRILARNLVAGGQGNAILRLGWEFNLKGWKWSTNNPKEFISYWRHIVTAMRSVPGQKLRFDWNPNVGDTPHQAELYYPGGKYVDYVGVDVYDVSWTKDTYPYGADCDADCRQYRQEKVWDRLYSGHYGLMFWSDFARSKKKPMSIPEWGLWRRPDGHGGGDNPYFVTQMHAFIDDPYNRVAYQGYLQADVADGQHKLTTLKKAGQAYRKLFK